MMWAIRRQDSGEVIPGEVRHPAHALLLVRAENGIERPQIDRRELARRLQPFERIAPGGGSAEFRPLLRRHPL